MPVPGGVVGEKEKRGKRRRGEKEKRKKRQRQAIKVRRKTPMSRSLPFSLRS
jgi:hypothetical protein